MWGNSTQFQTLRTFANRYWDIHGYLGSCICVIGIVTNSVTAAVLTQRKLRSNINLLLICVACFNVITNGFCLTFLIHYRIQRFACTSDRETLPWARFELAYAHMTAFTHGSVAFLTMATAAWRYFVLLKPAERRTLILWNPPAVLIVVVVTCFAVCLFLLPNSLCYTVKLRQYIHQNCTNQRLFSVALSRLALRNEALIFRINLWTAASVFKLIPCILITILSIMMIRQLRRVTNQRMRHLRRSQPTTGLLLAILICTLLADIPSATLLILAATKIQPFYSVYQELGDFTELISLLKMQIIFSFYCSTSSYFRRRMIQMFIPRMGQFRPSAESIEYELATGVSHCFHQNSSSRHLNQRNVWRSLLNRRSLGHSRHFATPARRTYSAVVTPPQCQLNQTRRGARLKFKFSASSGDPMLRLNSDKCL